MLTRSLKFFFLEYTETGISSSEFHKLFSVSDTTVVYLCTYQYSLFNNKCIYKLALLKIYFNRK